MPTFAMVAFLAVHSLLHAAIWLPHLTPDPERPPPFQPDHSGVLAAVAVPHRVERRLAVWLAVATTVLYLFAAAAIPSESAWSTSVVIAAAAVGIGMKVLFFHPWLILGLLLDLLILSAAVLDWPVARP